MTLFATNTTAPIGVKSMNKFSLGFIIGALAFSIGVGALGGWYLLRKNVSPNLVDPKNSEIKANSMNRVAAPPQWAELASILEQKNLLASPAPNNSEVIEIEEADS